MKKLLFILLALAGAANLQAMNLRKMRENGLFKNTDELTEHLKKMLPQYNARLKEEYKLTEPDEDYINSRIQHVNNLVDEITAIKSHLTQELEKAAIAQLKKIPANDPEWNQKQFDMSLHSEARNYPENAKPAVTAIKKHLISHFPQYPTQLIIQADPFGVAKGTFLSNIASGDAKGRITVYKPINQISHGLFTTNSVTTQLVETNINFDGTITQEAGSGHLKYNYTFEDTRKVEYHKKRILAATLGVGAAAAGAYYWLRNR